MPSAFVNLRPLVLLLLLSPMGCHGQSVAAGAATGATATLPASVTRRIEVLIRSRSNVPPNYAMLVTPAGKAKLPGFNQIDVSFVADGKASKPVRFLLSDDGKTLAQFSEYDISADPKALVSDAGRPGRGGPEDAPVVIVGFDDLECPYCGKMHAAVFPALTQRYGKSVRIVYKDYPLVEIHPWAMRAAVDVNCVAAQSTDGYWNLVDHIHAHAGELGGAEKSVATADKTLDTLARDEGKRDGLDAAKLDACLLKQDETAIRESMKLGQALGVDATPVFFVNGEKFGGAYPVEDLYRMIDAALLAEGKTPPPLPPPAPSAAPAAAGAKPGS